MRLPYFSNIKSISLLVSIPTCLAFYLIKMKEASLFLNKTVPSQLCEEMRKLDSSECIANIQFHTTARLLSIQLTIWIQS